MEFSNTYTHTHSSILSLFLSFYINIYILPTDIGPQFITSVSSITIQDYVWYNDELLRLNLIESSVTFTRLTGCNSHHVQ